MAIATYIAALVLLVVGIVLRLAMLRHRTEWGRSVKWYQVQYWFMPWKTVDYLTPHGMKLFTTSTVCLFLGVLLAVLAEGMS